MDIQEIMTLILTGTVGMLMLAIGVIFFVVIYQRKIMGQQEEMQGMEKKKQKDLLDVSLKIQEQTSKRIARDLHDSVGSNLSAIKLQTQRMEQKVRENTLSVELSQLISQMVDETIQNVRDISHELLPATLERLGLVTALQEVIRRLNNQDTITILFQANEDAPRWEEKKELHLFRIIQELINNTLKHAQAKNIEIYLYMSEKSLKLIYQDDGKGLDLSDSQKLKKGLGFRNIESRMQIIGGNIQYDSNNEIHEQGLQVRINISL